MLGDLGSSSDATTATATATATAMVIEPFGAHESGGGDGGVGSNSGEEEKNDYSRSGGGGGGGGGGGEEFGERSFGGNRWPRQATLALLKIRSDMDVAFRDASVKGPLWDEVSRKLAELGFHRSAKKCKEKFENVYKYHRRTKEGRTGKSDGKTYRFFDQLQALENQPPTPTTPNSISAHQPRPPQSTMALAVSNPPPLPTIYHINSTSTISTNTVPSAAPHQGIATPTIPTSLFPPTNPTIFPPPPQQYPTSHHQHHHQATTFVPPSTFPSISSTDLMSNSTSSSTSSDEEMEGRAKRKRKWKDLFETLMKEVVNKQEDLQKRFLEAIEKREHERMAREEAWRMQEMASINHEREILAQERSIAAAKDAAVMSFLQQIAEQQHNPQATPPTNLNNHLVTSQTPQPPSVQQSVAPPPPHPQRQQTTPPAALQITQAPVTTFEITPRANGENNNGDNNNLVSPTTTPTSSRWPRVEIHSLINLRTSLDSKYQENVPKGPLWEEISAGMKKLGYNRSAKRCKEKWENINKYFKKVKERNKKRPEDSKTCPYFHLLDSLYRERNHKFDHHQNGNSNNNNADNVNNSTKPENAAPMMVRPEQQWQPPSNQENEEEEREGDEDEEDDDEEDEGNYEIVANKGASVSVGATAAQ